MDRPFVIVDAKRRFDSFSDGKMFAGKKRGRLPAMGWNSWNAFGSGNTEALTKAMAERIVELGLDKLGYRYVVLDDGCYRPERVDGKLANEEMKFPSGFRALSDYIHSKGLKFGMYNDIGTNLCAGAAVGTCGHEAEDARSYVSWGVDFLKVDNCYYLWDNATFSNAENARYTYAPRIREVSISGNGKEFLFTAEEDGVLFGRGVEIRNGYATNIGTFDGTGPDHTPVGEMSGELRFVCNVESEGRYALKLEYATGRESGVGEWLQLAVDHEGGTEYFYDDHLPQTEGTEAFVRSGEIGIRLWKGKNIIRLMNHRRQENTLCSYATLLDEIYKISGTDELLLSICEWGKTQPQNWGYKVGDSWRILNDITFQVGADGDPGHGAWESDYTPGVASQYNKAVVMDEFAGLEKGWNDPDMLMVGMDGLDMTMCRTHFAMWCMMNSPLMLGLDLRRVQPGDELHRIISNAALIALNQDPLGVQAKRVYSTAAQAQPDKEYIRDNDRVDILAKPLADGSIAVAFFNLSGHEWEEKLSISLDRVLSCIGSRLPEEERFRSAAEYVLTDLWSSEESVISGKEISAEALEPHGNVCCRIRPVSA